MYSSTLDLFIATSRNVILIQPLKWQWAHLPSGSDTSHNLIKTDRLKFGYFPTARVLKDVWCSLGFTLLHSLLLTTPKPLGECVPADSVMILEMGSKGNYETLLRSQGGIIKTSMSLWSKKAAFCITEPLLKYLIGEDRQSLGIGVWALFCKNTVLHFYEPIAFNDFLSGETSVTD